MKSSQTSLWMSLLILLMIAMPTKPADAQTSFTAEAHADPITPVVPVAAHVSDIDLDATGKYRLALLRMKGQLNVARPILQLREKGAEYHLGQPLEAIFAETKGELEKRSAPFTTDTLDTLKQAGKTEPRSALAEIELGVNAINGSFAQTGGMSAGAALNLGEVLLRDAVALYSDAVTDNSVHDIAKYQMGRGLVTEAEALLRHASGLAGKPGHERLLAIVTLIRQAWPAVIPLSIVFDPADISERLKEAISTMKQLRTTDL